MFLGLLPKAKIKLCAQRKEKDFEVFVEGFTKTFQKYTPLNLEHRNFLIVILVGDLPGIKKQIEDKCSWMGGTTS